MGRAALWWTLLALCAGGLYALQVAGREGGPGEGPSAAEEFAGRYAVGAARALPGAAVLERMRLDELPPRARLRMVPVLGEVLGTERARAELERLREGLGADPDFKMFSRIHGELSPPVPDAGFVRRNGWFARLALSRGLPDDHPLRREVLGKASRTFLGAMLATLGGLAALVLGVVLLPLGLAALRRGRLRFAFEPPPRAPGDHVWLETTTIFLAGTIATAFLGLWFMWALLLVPLWPLARGVPRGEWRAGLGLSRGRGLAKEVRAGVVGYLAGMPVFAAGALLTVLIARVTGKPLSHPAIDEAASGEAFPLARLFLAACVWAPLVEEACFRGALQRYLRARMPRVAAAALVGAVFAFVHPQGPAAIPALLAVGGWLAMLREWRGSLVACVAAHALHNLALVSLATLALR
jgi:membrane protease YdiL (CAAX protease family)